MQEGKKLTDKQKKIITVCVAIIAICFLGAIGFGRVFAFLLLLSLGVLIYRAVKKKPKKNAAIAVAVFFVLTGIAGMLGKKAVPDDILDYMDTEERVVYQSYDKKDFRQTSDSTITNADTPTGGLPFVSIDVDERKVVTIGIDKNTKSSFHMNGLHVGDDLSQMEKCMERLNAGCLQVDSSGAMYMFSYKGWHGTILILFDRGRVGGINVVKFE